MPVAEAHPLYPSLLLKGMGQAIQRGDHDSAERHHERALAAHHSGDDPGLDRLFEPESLFLPSRRLLDGGLYEQAATATRLAADKAQQHAQLGQASIYYSGVVAMRELGGLDPEASKVLADEGLTFAIESGSQRATAFAATGLAGVVAQDSPSRAYQLLAESLETTGRPGQEQTGDLAQAAIVALKLRDWELALTIGARVIWLTRWQPDQAMIAGQLACCARGLVDTRPEVAEVLVGAAYAAFRRAAPQQSPAPSEPRSTPPTRGNPVLGALRDTHAIATEHLGEDEARSLRSRGAALELNDAVAYARNHINALPVLTVLHQRTASPIEP